MLELLIFVLTAITILYSTKSFLNYQTNDEKEYLSDIKEIDIIYKKDDATITDTQAGLVVAIISKVSYLDNNESDFEKAFKKATFIKLANYFDDKNDMIEIFETIYQNEADNNTNLLDFVHQYYQSTDFDYNKRFNLLNYILLLLFIDGMYEQKSAIICDIYKTLRISQSDFENSVAIINRVIDEVSQKQHDGNINHSDFENMVISILPDLISEAIDDARLANTVNVLYPLNKMIVKNEDKESGTN